MQIPNVLRVKRTYISTDLYGRCSIWHLVLKSFYDAGKTVIMSISRPKTASTTNGKKSSKI